MAAPLPIDRARDAIVDACFENRVTLVLGSTGCGKSSRVPQMLLQDLGGPILCTQPRRLAVVSIAKRVAEEMHTPLGGSQVGYRIGQRAHYTSQTRLVFATAGVLLEELKGQGSAALGRYKAVIIDEVHERSVESDLVLACVRELMREHRRLKLVLMSATCEAEAFSTFFKPVADGRVARVQVADMGQTLSSLLHGTTVKYLEETLALLAGQQDVSGIPLPLPLPLKPGSSGAGAGTAAGSPGTPSPRSSAGSLAALTDDGAPLGRGDSSGGGGSGDSTAINTARVALYRSHLEQLKAAPHKMEHSVLDTDQRLICDLVASLHQQAKDPGHAILIFLPTYRTLEMQHELLLASGLPLAIFALHSSVDIDEAVAAMGQMLGGGRRKVILATNIAESSVTIPSVRFVIDACRTLELRWDRGTQRSSPKIVFASRSQADQRKGRTGRTCEGTVFRLLPRRVFLEHLPAWERPALTLQHLRREVLGLQCAAAPAMANPPALLAKCMSPPEPTTAADALAFLAGAGAVEFAAGGGGRGGGFGYAATSLGRFLAHLPVSMEAALMLERGGKAGVLREAAALAVLLNTSPLPIRQPFSQREAFRQNLQRYEPGAEPSDAVAVLQANLAAFLFWDGAWRDAQRTRRLRELAGLQEPRSSESGSKSSSNEGGSSGSGGGGSSSTESSASGSSGGGGSSGCVLPDVDLEEQEWCNQHGLIRSSLHAAAELADLLMAAVHQHRPSFLASAYFSAATPPRRPTPHACQLKQAPRQWGVDAAEGGGLACSTRCVGLAAWFTPQERERLEQLLLTKDCSPASLASCSQREEDEAPYNPWAPYSGYGSSAYGSGGAYGGSLVRSVAPLRRSQLCRFFLSPGGCNKSSSCRFSHEVAAALCPDLRRRLAAPVRFWAASPSPHAGAAAFLHDGARSVVLLGEGDLALAEALAADAPPGLRLAASVLPSREQWLATYPAATKRLRRLERLAVGGDASEGLSLHFGIDATRLHGEDIDWRLPATDRIVFTFPHTGDDEDDEGHKRLMRDFFGSAAAMLLRRAAAAAGASGAQRGGHVAAPAAPRCDLLLTLCNDQLSRWHAEAAARDAFWFMTASEPFDPAAFPGYTPVRGSDDEPFPHGRAITYSFAFMPPADCLRRAP